LLNVFDQSHFKKLSLIKCFDICLKVSAFGIRHSAFGIRVALTGSRIQSAVLPRHVNGALIDRVSQKKKREEQKEKQLDPDFTF
jgi:hypothetical protein